jgi:acyl-CoA synthetase (AMP-forming)/AMP-acid ligase II
MKSSRFSRFIRNRSGLTPGVFSREVEKRTRELEEVGSTELTKWCRDRLAPYKIPHYIEFRDMLPKSKVGKLLRREIRDEEKRKLEKEKRKPV